MRRPIIALAATAALAAVLVAPVAAEEPLRQSSERSFDAAGIASVRVENTRGRVTVTRSPDGKVHLTTLKIVRTGDRERSRRIADALEVTTGVADRVLDVRVRYPERTSVHMSLWQLLRGYDLPRVEMRLSLQVPDPIAVHVATASGDVLTENLHGAQTLSSASGDLTVAGARGAVEAVSSSGDIEAADLASARLRSTSGDIRVRDARGRLHARTTSGDLRVNGAGDSLDLETVSGDVRVNRAPRGARVRTTSGRVVLHAAGRDIRIDSSSGDVDLELTGRLDRADVHTASGSIRTWMSGGSGCVLDLRTSSGALDVSVPIRLQQATRHQVRGTVGDGSAQVTLKTSSGDIAVRGERI